MALETELLAGDVVRIAGQPCSRNIEPENAGQEAVVIKVPCCDGRALIEIVGATPRWRRCVLCADLTMVRPKDGQFRLL